MVAVYFDIDGTLLLWPEGSPGVYREGMVPIVNDRMVRHLRKHVESGEFVVIWSGNSKSIDYLKKQHPEIASLADAILQKPTIFYDDSQAWIGNRLWVGLQNINGG